MLALVQVVVAHGFQLDAPGVVPKSGVVGARVLRKMARGVDDAAADPDHVVMNPNDQRSAPHHKREMLQANSLR
jgi:hypothetical protein